MTVNQLRIFLIAAETKSFVKTAERLFIASSAVSRQVSAMERELGTPLFSRKNNVLSLTAAGQLFLDELHPLAQSFQTLVQKTVAVGTGTVGRLRICVQSDQQLDGVFCRVLQDFSRLHPQVVLELERVRPEQIHDALLTDRFDAGILLFQSPAVPEGFSRMDCRTEPLYLCVHRSLAGEAATLAQIEAAAPIYMASPGLYPAAIREEMFRLARTSDLDLLHPDYLSSEAVELITAAGLGATVANQSHLLLTNPELRFYPLEEAPVIQKGFLWKSNTTNPLVSQTPDSLAAVIARAQEASISSG